jgi:hypothetical protein
VLVKTEEVVQIVDEQLSEGAQFEPRYAQRYYIDNILKRVFAYIFGWDYINNVPVRLKANQDGTLRVSSVSIPFSVNDTKSGNAPDTYETPLTFDQDCGEVDVFIFDNAALIQRSTDGTTWQDEIEIPANTMYSFSATTRAIRIKNKTAGSTARYQIVGWY